jgi:hypothetical protein
MIGGSLSYDFARVGPTPALFQSFVLSRPAYWNPQLPPGHGAAVSAATTAGMASTTSMMASDTRRRGKGGSSEPPVVQDRTDVRLSFSLPAPRSCEDLHIR